MVLVRENDLLNKRRVYGGSSINFLSALSPILGSLSPMLSPVLSSLLNQKEGRGFIYPMLPGLLNTRRKNNVYFPNTLPITLGGIEHNPKNIEEQVDKSIEKVKEELKTGTGKPKKNKAKLNRMVRGSGIMRY